MSASVPKPKKLEDYLHDIAESPDSVYLRASAKLYKMLRDQRKALKISQVCVATAMTYFHQFYYQSTAMEDHHPLVVLAASTLLASKVENTPKSTKSIIRSFFPKEKEVQKRTDQIVVYEELLIQKVDFTFIYPHAYADLGKFLNSLKDDVLDNKQKATFRAKCGLILNESYSTPVYLAFTSNQKVFIRFILKVVCRVVIHDKPDTEKITNAFETHSDITSQEQKEGLRCLAKALNLQCESALESTILSILEEVGKES